MKRERRYYCALSKVSCKLTAMKRVCLSIGSRPATLSNESNPSTHSRHLFLIKITLIIISLSLTINNTVKKNSSDHNNNKKKNERIKRDN